MASQFERIVHVVDSHTAGEPTRVVTGGLPNVPGATMADKRAFLRQHCDALRSGLVCEPRGHDAIVAAYLLPPCDPTAHAGVVFANDVGYLGMCGHGAIGVATTLLAMGMVAPASADGDTEIRLDTPVGTVVAQVAVRDGRPGAVRLRNVPSFLHARDVEVPVEGIGRVTVDVAWGGNWFAILPEDELGVAVEPERLPALLERTMAVREALIRHDVFGFDPATGAPQEIDHVEVYRVLRHPDARVATRTMTLCPGRAYDRSPCGTGTSAKIATLHARGEIAPGDVFVNQSVIGTEFRARILAVDRDGDRTLVTPEIEGQAWITGLQQLVFDPTDPLKSGLTR